MSYRYAVCTVLDSWWSTHAATQPVWRVPDAVCTVLDSWWSTHAATQPIWRVPDAVCTVLDSWWSTQAATQPVWRVPDAVCTVLDSWWWTERPSETCRVFQNKINWRYCASGWFYYRNLLCVLKWSFSESSFVLILEYSSFLFIITLK
jgi:hypothetical protein